jgi:hypothetical protein
MSLLVFEEFLRNLRQSSLDSNKLSMAEVYLLETFLFFPPVKEKVPGVLSIFLLSSRND